MYNKIKIQKLTIGKLIFRYSIEQKLILILCPISLSGILYYCVLLELKTLYSGMSLDFFWRGAAEKFLGRALK